MSRCLAPSVRLRCLGTAAAWLGVSLLLAAPAAAHQVWVEQDAAGAKLYFGEFADNLHEVSPGYLDKLGKPTATLVAAKGENKAEKLLTVTKQRDGFVIAGKAAPGEAVIVVDSAYPVSESKGTRRMHPVRVPERRARKASTEPVSARR